jgi:hypothetical protein
MLIALPTLIICLHDRLEPNSTKSRIEAVLPRRANPLQLNDEPHAVAPKIESELPILAPANKLHAEPARKQLLKLTELPANA